MNDGAFLSSLSLITLIVALVVVGGAFAYFMRKRSNRHPMDTPSGRAAEEAERRRAESNRH